MSKELDDKVKAIEDGILKRFQKIEKVRLIKWLQNYKHEFGTTEAEFFLETELGVIKVSVSGAMNDGFFGEIG